MTTEKKIIMPAIGEGIYLVKDVAKILSLEYSKVRRWIVGYWSGSLQEDYDYTFGDEKQRAINFYSLIEFYTFFKLREKGISAIEIRKLHHELSKIHKTPYPFAFVQEFFAETRKSRSFVYFNHLQSLMKFDHKKQYSFSFAEEFLDKIEFDENNLAAKFYPLGNEKTIVVDPKHQFGQPVIVGTNIKTQTIFNLYKSGEPIDNICSLYDLTVANVQDVIEFHKPAA